MCTKNLSFFFKYKILRKYIKRKTQHISKGCLMSVGFDFKEPVMLAVTSETLTEIFPPRVTPTAFCLMLIHQEGLTEMELLYEG